MRRVFWCGCLVEQCREADETAGSAVGGAERQAGTVSTRDRGTELRQGSITGRERRARPSDRRSRVADQPADQVQTEPRQTVGGSQGSARGRNASPGQVSEWSSQFSGFTAWSVICARCYTDLNLLTHKADKFVDSVVDCYSTVPCQISSNVSGNSSIIL